VHFKGIAFDKPVIYTAINSLAKYLSKKYISGSPFVLLPAYNHIKTLIAFYAIIKSGKIAVLYDPQSRAIDLSEIIQDVDPCAILYLNSVSIKFLYEEEILFRKPNNTFIINSDLKDVQIIAYTNAEDGYSKGAMLTEKNLLSEIEALIQTNKLNFHSVTCALLPFSHLFGFMQGILVPTHMGGQGFITELNLLNLIETLKEIKHYKVTHIYSVPSLYYIMGKIPGLNTYIQNVKEFYSGGTKLSNFISNGFQRKTNREIREGYGLTECSPGVVLNFEEEGPKENSIGKPMPGVDVKIFSKENKECATYEVGEICIKGDMIFKGYFNNPSTTENILKNGWVFTGDYGMKDKEGFLYFCGLKKNMINVAGVNVYPNKLERMMKLNKNASEVIVFGEESLLQGQIVVARIKLYNNQKAFQEEFKDWCTVNINNTILPKIWQFE